MVVVVTIGEHGHFNWPACTRSVDLDVFPAVMSRER
jgi:hypothetical protein